MFGIVIKYCLELLKNIVILSCIVNDSNHAKCVLLSDKKCKT